jgi:hypothetical protein
MGEALAHTIGREGQRIRARCLEVGKVHAPQEQQLWIERTIDYRITSVLPISSVT